MQRIRESLQAIMKNSQPATGERRWTRPAVCAVVVIIALLPLLLRSPYTLHILILTFIYIIVAVSFRTIIISGQFPLAHAAFMGIGAYVAGLLSRWLGWPPWSTIPAGALAAMAVGIMIGYPFARLRALYYAMGSLFFGIGVIYIIYAFQKYTGGYNGLAGIQPLFATGSKVVYYYFFLGLALVSIFALYRFEFSRIGVNLKAIAQSYLVASSVGINEASYRIMVVGFGCFFAGLAGATFAHYNLVVATGSFNLTATLWIAMYVLIGGINSFSGPIIGTVIGFIIPEVFRGLKIYSPFVFAVILLIVLYLMPRGLVSLPQIASSRFLNRKKKGSVADAAGN